MTKEQLFSKWTINPDFKYDIEAVIATEIEKAKVQPAPFDRDRFEAMFCAVVASEPHYTYKDCMIETEKLLTQLDSFYFEKTSK